MRTSTCVSLIIRTVPQWRPARCSPPRARRTCPHERGVEAGTTVRRRAAAGAAARRLLSPWPALRCCRARRRAIVAGRRAALDIAAQCSRRPPNRGERRRAARGRATSAWHSARRGWCTRSPQRPRARSGAPPLDAAAEHCIATAAAQRVPPPLRRRERAAFAPRGSKSESERPGLAPGRPDAPPSPSAHPLSPRLLLLLATSLFPRPRRHTTVSKV